MSEKPTKVFKLFPNQVAGHGGIMTELNNSGEGVGKLYKPYNRSELAFYDQISQESPKLLPFIPKLIDCVYVQYINKSMNEERKECMNVNKLHSHSVITRSAPLTQPLIRALNREQKTKEEIERKRKEEIENINKREKVNFSFNSNSNSNSNSRNRDRTSKSAKIQKSINLNARSSASHGLLPRPTIPVEGTVSVSDISTFLKAPSCRVDETTFRYMVLEDLTVGYSKPCLLDLKLGTRQHGLDASSAKASKQIEKCRTTTSARYGFRLCGMQKYRCKEGRYYSHDKYFGRLLTSETLYSSIRSWFFNGSYVDYKLIRWFTDRFISLLSILSSMNGYRFYSSSLLLVYDGAAAQGDIKASRPALKLIDFAHSLHSLGPEASNIDDGAVLGLRTLITIFTDLLKSADHSK